MSLVTFWKEKVRSYRDHLLRGGMGRELRDLRDDILTLLGEIDVITGTSPYVAQDTWFVDGVLGDDNNTGKTSGLALKTLGEVYRRTKDTPLTQTTTVNVLSDVSDPIQVQRHLYGNTFYGIKYVGLATQVFSGTVATYSAVKHTVTANATQMTCAAIADWTPYLYKRVRFTSGAAAGCVAFVTRANPQGTGVATARLTPPINVAFPGNASAALANAAPGDSFVIEDLPTVPGIDVNVVATVGSGTQRDVFWADSLKISQLSGWNVVTSGGWCSATFFGCYLDFVNSSGAMFAVGCLFKPQTPAFIFGASRLFAYGCGFVNCVFQATNYSSMFFARNTLFDNASLNPVGGSFVQIALTGAQFFDCAQTTNDGITLGANTILEISSGVSVSGNGNGGYGIKQEGPGTFVRYGTTPTLTGALGDRSIAGNIVPWSVGNIKLGESSSSVANTRCPDALEVAVAFGAAVTSVAVNFPAGVTLSGTGYKIEFCEEAPVGGNPAPASGPWPTSKTATGFTANITVAPGAGVTRNFTARIKN